MAQALEFVDLSEYLGKQEECTLCIEPHADGKTIDHVIPQLAYKKNQVLRPLIKTDDDNTVTVCGGVHADLDGKKIKAYDRFGMIGVALYIGTQYTRATREGMLMLQWRQFVRLADKAYQSLIPPEDDPTKIWEYDLTKRVFAHYLTRWQVPEGFVITDFDRKVFKRVYADVPRDDVLKSIAVLQREVLNLPTR